MKVYVLFDKVSCKVRDVFANKKDAEEARKACSHQQIQEFELIQPEVAMKSIKDVDEKVYDPLHADSVMPFGKYKGELVSEIAFKEPDYLIWCMNNVNLALDEEVLGMLEH